MSDEDEVIDCELGRLLEFIDLINGKISDIRIDISRSSDPESDGLLNRGEYFIGIAFVAIQQHFVDTLLFTGINKDKAYKLGSLHSSGVTYATLINCSANWWKHEAEWFGNDKVQKRSNKTISVVMNVSKQYEYTHFQCACINLWF